MSHSNLSSKHIHNFNSGPGILPKEVVEQAAVSLVNHQNSGLSIAEIGHRTSLFTDVMEEARQLVRELMQLDDEHEVLFLHGGASTQFMQVPMNLLDEKGCAAYADTGVWSTKAIKEANLFGKTEVVCSSRDKNYHYIPKDFAVPNEAQYFHITSNNTIYGTQWKRIPEVSIPLVADMSSDILSRQLNFNRFALIYAGAQKNLGAAGCTIVVVNKNILGKTRRSIPTMFDYRLHIKEKSILNTPPVMAIYISMLTLRWLKSQGGSAALQPINERKSLKLYTELEQNGLFYPLVSNAEDRSITNVCFAINEKALEPVFSSFCKENGIYGINGHRLAGGFRASLYNALPESSVDYLIEVLHEFMRIHG